MEINSEYNTQNNLEIDLFPACQRASKYFAAVLRRIWGKNFGTKLTLRNSTILEVSELSAKPLNVITINICWSFFTRVLLQH